MALSLKRDEVSGGRLGLEVITEGLGTHASERLC